MKQCPICDLELSEPIPPFCSQCGWDLKNDLTLVPSLSLPEPVVEEYTQRYRAAKRVWNERLEILRRQEEWEKRFRELEAKVKDSAVIRQDELEKRFVKLESDQADWANRLKSIDELEKKFAKFESGQIAWAHSLSALARQDEVEKRFAKLESAQADLIKRLKAVEKIEASVKDLIPPPAGTLWTEPLTVMEFVYVPAAGIFMMGDVLGDNHYDNEKPVHEVELDGFYIGKYPVTQGQYKKITGNNPSHFKKGDNYPAESVSWDDAKAFARQLSERTGKIFRLPTEAEWEYAARSGGKEERYSGGSDADAVAWYGNNSGSSTHPVGQKKANGLGIYDMSGNVWEWCEDIYAGDAYSKHQRKNPIYTGSGSSRVLRGGSWSYDPVGVRCAYRSSSAPASGSTMWAFAS